MSFAERFDWICTQYADQIAVHDLKRKVTYREFAAMVARMRARVIKVAAPSAAVALFLPNDVCEQAALMAVLTAGRAIVPLDSGHPLERNRAIVHDAGVVAILTAGTLATTARKLAGAKIAVVNVDKAAGVPADSVPANPDNLAWILYTSGSTGKPKGVYQNHRGMMDNMMEAIAFIGINETDRQASYYSMAVMAGMRTAISGFLAGAALHILPPRVLGPQRLAHELKRRRISVHRSSATLLRHVVHALGPGGTLEDMGLVTLGGDQVHWADYDLVRRSCPNARIGCHLGSTECATCYLQWFIDDSIRADAPLMPVGRVGPDCEVALCDEQGRPVTHGEVGEIVVSGATIALGYWTAPELTAHAFSVDPRDPGRRIFRTGDLGRRRRDGLFEFAGRTDHQIKLHGFRIELGEIEAALRSCSGIRDAAVVVRRKESGQPKALVAYVQLADGVKGLLPRHVTEMAGQRLPAHMIPADTFVLDALPWLPNFKIDRRRLEEIDKTHARGNETIADPVMADVARVFADVLKARRVTPDDSLATLGGDSLQAVEIVLRLERKFGFKTPPSVFRASGSIRALSQWIARKSAAGRKPAQARASA